MSTDLVLKIKNANGDLQQLSSANEKYLSYLAGCELVNPTASFLGQNGTFLSSGNVDLGSYTDSKYVEPVGTHPASQISVTTTTYPLKMQERATGGAAAQWYGWELLQNKPFFYPIGYGTKNTKVGVHAFDSDSLFSLANRLNGSIIQNQYPGAYRLDSAGFDPNETEWKKHNYYGTNPRQVFSTDNRTDGTSTDYEIWVKKGSPLDTMPSGADRCQIPHIVYKDSDGNIDNTLRPVKGISNPDGVADGSLKESSDSDLSFTLGSVCRYLKSTENAIGSYKLMAGNSVPTEPSGSTWISCGTAKDTRNLKDDVNHLKDRVSVFTRFRSQDYAGTYVGTYNRMFTGNYTGDYARHFTGDYTAEYAGDYTAEYTGDYTSSVQKTYTGNYSGIYSRTSIGYYSRHFTRDFVGDYTRHSSRLFVGDYTGLSFTSEYAGDYVGDYTRNYSGDYVGDFISSTTASIDVAPASTRVSILNSTLTYTGNYTGDFTAITSTRHFTRSRVVEYSGQYARTRTSTYAGDFTREFVGDYTGTYTANFAGNFAGDFTRQYIAEFTGDFAGFIDLQYSGNYVGVRIVPESGGYFTRAVSLQATSLSRTQSPSLNNTLRGLLRLYSRLGWFTQWRSDVVSYSQFFSRVVVSPTWRHEIKVSMRIPQVSYILTGQYTGVVHPTYVGPQTDINGNAVKAYYVGNYIMSQSPAAAVSYYSRSAAVGDDGNRWSIRNGYVLHFSRVTRLSPPSRTSYPPYLPIMSQHQGYHWEQYTRTFSRTVGFSRSYVGPFDYVGNYVGGYQRTSARIVSQFYVGPADRTSTRVSTLDINKDFSRVSTVERNATSTRGFSRVRYQTTSLTFVGDYTRVYTTDFTRVSTRDSTRTYVGNYTGDFIDTYIAYYIGDYSGATSTRVSAVTTQTTSTRVSVREGNSMGNYIGDFATTYIGDYTAQYSRIYTGDYTSSIEKFDVDDYTGTYSRTSVRVSTFDFTRTTTADFARLRSPEFTRISVRDRYEYYSGGYAGVYTDFYGQDNSVTYVGDYIGSTILGSYEDIQTYTLYGRVA